MKLIKRVISSICAVAMIASITMITSVSAVTAQPALDTTVVYDETTGEGTVTVSIKGLADISAYPQLTQFQVNVSYAGNFDSSLYTYNPTPTAPLKKNVTGNNITLSLNNIPADNMFKVGYLNGASEIFADQDLFTIKFKVTDTSVDNKLVFSGSNIFVNPYDESFNMASGAVSFGQAGAEGVFDGVLNMPSEVVIPKVGGDDEPEITQGVITKEQSGSENDEAVWAWTTAAATGNFLKVYADVTKVGATEATQVYNTFKIPANVEATNVKVGIVVQYNPTNIDEFVVTGMEIVSSAN